MPQWPVRDCEVLHGAEHNYRRGRISQQLFVFDVVQLTGERTALHLISTSLQTETRGLVTCLHVIGWLPDHVVSDVL